MKKSCLGVSGVSGDRLFFTRTTLPSAAPTAAATQGNQWPEEFMLGVIVGLACYNGVLVNLPLVDIVYKLFNNGEVRRGRENETLLLCSSHCRVKKYEHNFDKLICFI